MLNVGMECYEFLLGGVVMCSYANYINILNQCLGSLEVSDLKNQTISSDEGLDRWCQLTKVLQLNNGTMFFIGNGASAMMASHMAADASKNGGFRALAFNDPALLTAVSNDICYEHSFAVPLKRFANPGDILITISSSGNSPNIIDAILVARKFDLHVITISGMKPDNKSRQLGDLNFYIPANTYGLAEAAHQALLHCWLDLYMEQYPEVEAGKS